GTRSQSECDACENIDTDEDPLDPECSDLALPLTYDTVLIPIVSSSGDISWVAPVEEIRTTSPAGIVGPYATGTPGIVSGVVALRINYPFQSATISRFEFPDEPDTGILAVSADDSALTPGNSGRYTLIGSENSYVDGVSNIHGGAYGLGRQLALPSDRNNIRQFGVRPYRRILSFQAIYRREVLE
ncbi:MAG: hypothetical protein AAF517_06290, partial [Planctomycetota bacterium]